MRVEIQLQPHLLWPGDWILLSEHGSRVWREVMGRPSRGVFWEVPTKAGTVVLTDSHVTVAVVE